MLTVGIIVDEEQTRSGKIIIWLVSDAKSVAGQKSSLGRKHQQTDSRQGIAGQI